MPTTTSEQQAPPPAAGAAAAAKCAVGCAACQHQHCSNKKVVLFLLVLLVLQLHRALSRVLLPGLYIELLMLLLLLTWHRQHHCSLGREAGRLVTCKRRSCVQAFWNWLSISAAFACCSCSVRVYYACCCSMSASTLSGVLLAVVFCVMCGVWPCFPFVRCHHPYLCLLALCRTSVFGGFCRNAGIVLSAYTC